MFDSKKIIELEYDEAISRARETWPKWPQNLAAALIFAAMANKLVCYELVYGGELCIVSVGWWETVGFCVGVLLLLFCYLSVLLNKAQRAFIERKKKEMSTTSPD